MRALMVQGTSSWAGKSLLTTALCRHFARQGVRVAPFKAQNMSNNARVVDGGEIGVAQYLQARAARVVPDVRMNPVLIKPEADTRSQVVVDGIVDQRLGATGWRERAPLLWPAISRALASLQAEYELIVLEGAGSPAEINLSDADAANLGAARAADAAVLMVSDIDRGGAFAHLFGTWALMAPADRARVEGFVLNKFRGDPALLSPAPEMLAERTGVPTVGVVPWLRHELPDEDGVAVAAEPERDDGRPVVGIVHYPAASNLDEFKMLEQIARVRWIRRPGDLVGAELVVLPGSKHVTVDLAWLRETGLDVAIIARARSGLRVLGICGGLQMLGEELRDAGGGEADADGLGLLPLRTTFGAEKLTVRTEARFAELADPWAPLSGVALQGYEIRQGHTEATAAVDDVLAGGHGWARGAVLGISVHGALEEPEVLRRLLGARPARTLDDALDDLTDAVTAGLDLAAIETMVGLR
ncbi:cobyric acid synthase [Baekduia sp.]|uniref:cobyric acid synthase n=1 Tax=Baekduia sp. TaxID=2600305 RepID=UPI002DFFCE34|nr:cobyric acid synthase [Baekduia sp.]